MKESIYSITFRVFNKMASENKPFSTKMVQDETIEQGGICRVENGVTIKDYFEEMRVGGYLTHIGDGMHLPTKKLQAALAASPTLIEKGINVETAILLEDLQLAVSSNSMDEYEIRKIIRDRQKREAGIL